MEASGGIRTLTARSTDNGTFTLSGVAAGRYTVTIRRLGYAPRDSTYVFSGRDTSIAISLTRVASLDPLVIGAGPGAYGVVANEAGLSPLPKTRVDIVGTNRHAVTDSVGRFAVALPAAGRFLVRISRAGFVSNLQWVNFGEEHYTNVTVLLAEGGQSRRGEAVLWAEFDERMRWRGQASAIVPGSELRRYGNAPLSDALRASPSFARSGLRIGASTCVFINGRPAPNWPLDAFDVDRIEAVELYGPRGDPTNSLASSWPFGQPCGQTRIGSLNRSQSGIAQLVSIWMRP